MNEQDTKAAAQAVREGIDKLIAADPGPPEMEAVARAAMTLAEGFIVNVARIADALEQIAENTSMIHRSDLW